MADEGPWKFLPCSACCDACEYFSDDFTRDDAPDPGADWTVKPGDSWPIVSNQLQTTDADSYCVCNTVHPDASVNVVVNATLATTADGDQARVIVNYTDEDNYDFAQVEWGTPNGSLKLFTREAGVETQVGNTRALDGFTHDYAISIQVCSGDERLVASVDTMTVGVERVATSSKAGFGTGTITGTVTFDDFTLNKSVVDAPECSQCKLECATCKDGLGPRYFRVDVAGVVNLGEVCCDALNAAYFLPPWINPINGGEGYCIWDLVLAPAVCEHNTLRITLNLIGGLYYVYLNIWGTAITVTYRSEGLAELDCLNFDGLVLTNIFEFDAQCDWPDTVTITAVQTP